jgi:hypothetical protein
MPPTYKCPLATPERIVTFGMEDTSKSYSPLQIARRLPGSNFYVMDVDWSPSYHRALETDFSDLTNVEVVECDPEDWIEQLSTAEQLTKRCEPGDWFVYDSLTQPWPAVQGWFTEEVFGQDEADYFLEVRKAKKEAGDAKKSLGALDGWKDWPVINKNYKRLNRLIRQCQGHVYATCEQTNITTEDDKDIRKLYGQYGVRPSGQKGIGHSMQTVLWFTKTSSGREITTVKDRNRTKLKDEPFDDFFQDYLVDIAGWKVSFG